MTKKSKTTKAKVKNATSVEAKDHLESAARHPAADFLKENAVPLALVAVSTGYIAANSINGGDNKVMNAGRDLAEKAGKSIAKAQKNLRTASGKAGEKAKAGAGDLETLVSKHPIATGLAALAFGAGVAAVALPKIQQQRASAQS